MSTNWCFAFLLTCLRFATQPKRKCLQLLEISHHTQWRSISREVNTVANVVPCRKCGRGKSRRNLGKVDWKRGKSSRTRQ